MDTMAILKAATMETVVTGIVAIMVRGVATVIGDEIKEQGESLQLMKAFPLQWRHSLPHNLPMVVPSAPILTYDYGTISKGRGTPWSGAHGLMKIYFLQADQKYPDARLPKDEGCRCDK